MLTFPRSGSAPCSCSLLISNRTNTENSRREPPLPTLLLLWLSDPALLNTKKYPAYLTVEQMLTFPILFTAALSVDSGMNALPCSWRRPASVTGPTGPTGLTSAEVHTAPSVVVADARILNPGPADRQRAEEND